MFRTGCEQQPEADFEEGHDAVKLARQLRRTLYCRHVQCNDQPISHRPRDIARRHQSGRRRMTSLGVQFRMISPFWLFARAPNGDCAPILPSHRKGGASPT